MAIHQAYHRAKMLTLLPLVGIALAVLFGVTWWVRPVLAAGAVTVQCPANGKGSVDKLRDAVSTLNLSSTLDTIIISVTGNTDCVFTLTDAVTNTVTGPSGLPFIQGMSGMGVIPRSVLIRAVGGRAVFTRWPMAPEFRLIESKANLTLENITLANGLAKNMVTAVPDSGGAILSHEALTLTNVVISGNVSYRGGGVFSEGPLVLNHVTADHNRTKSADTSDGGAIYATGLLSANNITITNNAGVDCGCGSDEALGGGIFVTGTATVANAYFFNNIVNGFNGGGLYVTGDLTVTSSSFISNSAGFLGGGLVAGRRLKLSNSDFISNVANYSGGGLFIGHIFDEFSASNGLSGRSSVTASRFINNLVFNTGGGLSTGDNITVTLVGNNFTGNSAQNGGGAGIDAGLVRNNLFENNYAGAPEPIAGGGGLIAGQQATIEANRFISNSASVGGGVQIIYVPISGGAGAMTASSVEPIGSGFSFTSTSVDNHIVNNLFIDNEARGNDGAAIVAGVNIEGILGGFVQIAHNTIVSKKPLAGSALYITRSRATVSDNIITQHQIALQGVNAAVSADANLMQGAALNYLDVPNGAQDLTADPRFMDAAHGNYHLRGDSPARDSGIDARVKSDFDGLSRPQGKGFDRGAFEFGNHAPLAQPDSYTTAVGTALDIAALGVLANDSDIDGDELSTVLATAPTHGALQLQASGAFVYTPAAGFSGTDRFTYRAVDGVGARSAETTVTIEVAGDDTTQAVAIVDLKANNNGPATTGQPIHFVATVGAGSNIHFAWDFGDGARGEGQDVSHSYAAAGKYTVKITASNSLGSREATTTVTVQAVQQAPKARLVLPLLTK